MIYHMVPTAVWQTQVTNKQYYADSLATEGFIHCTGEADRLLWVANHFYRQDDRPYTILVIDPEQLSAEVRWEAADGHLFPHIYGPLETDAVYKSVPFPRDSDGTFLSPPLDVG